MKVYVVFLIRMNKLAFAELCKEQDCPISM